MAQLLCISCDLCHPGADPATIPPAGPITELSIGTTKYLPSPDGRGYAPSGVGGGKLHLCQAHLQAHRALLAAAVPPALVIRSEGDQPDGALTLLAGAPAVIVWDRAPGGGWQTLERLTEALICIYGPEWDSVGVERYDGFELHRFVRAA